MPAQEARALGADGEDLRPAVRAQVETARPGRPRAEPAVDLVDVRLADDADVEAAPAQTLDHPSETVRRSLAVVRRIPVEYRRFEAAVEELVGGSGVLHRSHPRWLIGNSR